MTRQAGTADTGRERQVLIQQDEWRLLSTFCRHSARDKEASLALQRYLYSLCNITFILGILFVLLKMSLLSICYSWWALYHFVVGLLVGRLVYTVWFYV